MKLIYTSIVVLLSTISYSQGIEIYTSGATQDISGTEITVVDGTGADVEMYYYFDLKNNTGAALNLRVVRAKLVEMSGGVEDYLCWGAHFNCGGIILFQKHAFWANL